MELKLTLALPRDEYSVPVARRVLSRSLEVLGVDEVVVADIELALTEACTNVLDHAADTDEYDQDDLDDELAAFTIDPLAS